MRCLFAVCALIFMAGSISRAIAVPIYDFSPITTEMQSFVQAHSLEGASLRVNKDGQVVYRRTFGGYTLNTRIRIASASKWLSALAIARLVEKGQMRWTDTVSMYFPSVDADKRAITLEQLFSHTSGLPFEEDACLSSPLFTLSTCAQRILQRPLIGEPGKVFAYGGNSMQVAGRMAEIASGKSWDDLFIDEMVVPLGLDATDYAGSSTVSGYVRSPHPTIDRSVRSTLEDYGKVMDMVLAQGCLQVRVDRLCMPAARFLQPATIAHMALDHSIDTVSLYRPPTSTGYGYGLGQWIDPLQSMIVSSPGGLGFTPWVDWTRRIAGVFLVDGLNVRVVDDINDIRSMVNVVTSDGAGQRMKPVLPPIPMTAPPTTLAAPAIKAASRNRSRR